MFCQSCNKKESKKKRGETLSRQEELDLKQEVETYYERCGHPYYASGRLWDDGILDPAQTRDVLGLALSSALNAPAMPTYFGVFRM